jgi:hypothetical protein
VKEMFSSRFSVFVILANARVKRFEFYAVQCCEKIIFISVRALSHILYLTSKFEPREYELR